MCGILGTTKQLPDNFGLGLHSIKHRGPDYTGIYRDQYIQIGHSLLAIRGDISESIQPVADKQGPWVLVFNGQLYNTEIIRAELGFDSPSTNVDTLLLFALIKKHGWKFIDFIHGMFAIALYNTHEKEIRLYRDQSGQKNLYYTTVANQLSFCSEIKGIIALGYVPHEIDADAISIATSIGYVPGKHTVVKDIFKLNPSEMVAYNLLTKELRREIFSSSGFGYYMNLSPEEVMQSVITEHLQSKKHIAINLSGGLDSSLIFHESVRQGHTLSAFSTFFDASDEKHNRDANLAKRLAKDYGQEFIPIQITKKSYLNHFVDAYTAIEEPNYNISIPIYYQTAVTEGIYGHKLRVVLSGDGGDELFGGYPHYAKIQRISRFKKLLTSTGVNLYKYIRSGTYINYNNVSDTFYALRSFEKNWNTNKLPEFDVRQYLTQSTSALMKAYQTKYDEVYQLMLFDRLVWLANENFIRSDKLYMGQSMEMRCPLAYTPLRTYMDTSIDSSKYTSSQTNKIFLRNLYNSKLPDYITKRVDKTGWRAPVQTWYDADYKNLFLEIITTVENRNDLIDWKLLKKDIEKNVGWPGKTIHLYLSIALLIKKFNLL